MTRFVCSGVGKQAVARPGIIYPFCPDCGRELSAQGRKARARLGNPWREIPRHYVAVELRPGEEISA